MHAIKLSFLSFAVSAGAATLSAQEVMTLPGTDRAAEPVVTDVYEIGGMSAPEWALFGRVASLAFDGAGNLYVHDMQNNRIAVVGENGRYLRDVAEQGGGPGEFGMPMAMAVAPDGSLSVFDVSHMGFLRFGSDGAYVDQDSHDFELGLPSPDGLVHDPAGGVLFSSAGSVAIRRGPDGTTRAGGTQGRPIRRVLAGEADGVAFDAWQLPQGEAEMETMSGSGFQFSTAMPTLRAFEPGLHFGALSDGRLVVSDTIDYSIKLVSSAGTIERVLHRDIDPQTVGRRERNAERERRLEEAEGAGGGGLRMVVSGGGGGGGGGSFSMGADAMQDMMKRRIENMEFAEEIPVVAGLRVDSWQNHIWVRRAADRIGDEGPVDVLTADGDYLGTLEGESARIPEAFGPGGLVAYVELDELDVPTVVVRRLRLDG